MPKTLNASDIPLNVSGEIDKKPLTGEISKDSVGRFWFSSETTWAGGTQNGSRMAKIKTFRGSGGSVPIYFRGSDAYKNGQQLIHIEDLRVGSAEPEELFQSVRCAYQHAGVACGYYHRDGAQRSPGAPPTLPALEGAPEMQMVFTGGAVELNSALPAHLEDFETHLDAFRRMLTFAVQRPIAQLSMVARSSDGAEVRILARQSVRPVASGSGDYRSFPI
ncbi:hypothetical protein [Leucobacter luti]|uniref:hypothetical protein n=1 Tax=Leucobacter luti TaxID=340320 RepID=UPI001C68FF79|nr:hypothetical protein [Leucobacter luti]QYM75602.1 hypothetical protein K1X41_13425 [Leucobacter luti]